MKLWIGRVLVGLLFLSGCETKRTPPGPTVVGATVAANKSFTFLQWDEGLTVMLWLDVPNQGSGGHGSTEDPIHRQHGHASTSDGSRRVDWDLQTKDGKAGLFRLAKTEYDLSKGRLFLVTTDDEWRADSAWECETEQRFLLLSTIAQTTLPHRYMIIIRIYRGE